MSGAEGRERPHNPQYRPQPTGGWCFATIPLTMGGTLFTYAAMPKTVTYVRLEPEVKQALMRVAEIDGRSLSALIAKIASDWVKPYAAKPAKEQRR